MQEEEEEKEGRGGGGGRREDKEEEEEGRGGRGEEKVDVWIELEMEGWKEGLEGEEGWREGVEGWREGAEGVEVLSASGGRSKHPQTDNSKASLSSSLSELSRILSTNIFNSCFSFSSFSKT